MNKNDYQVFFNGIKDKKSNTSKYAINSFIYRSSGSVSPEKKRMQSYIFPSLKVKCNPIIEKELERLEIKYDKLIKSKSKSFIDKLSLAKGNPMNRTQSVKSKNINKSSLMTNAPFAKTYISKGFLSKIIEKEPKVPLKYKKFLETVKEESKTYKKLTKKSESGLTSSKSLKKMQLLKSHESLAALTGPHLPLLTPRRVVDIKNTVIKITLIYSFLLVIQKQQRVSHLRLSLLS
jgi:hypothetical protein